MMQLVNSRKAGSWSRSAFLRAFPVVLLAVLLVAGCALIRHDTPTVRIMTFNIHHGEGEDGIYDIGRIADFILTHKPDLVMLQEVDRGFSERSNNEDQPTMLADHLGYHYFYGPNIGDSYGNMILSRFPLDGAINIPLPNPAGKEPRGLIYGTVEIGGKRIALYCTHLSAFSAENRARQIARLGDILMGQKYPAICGGDFNTRPSEQLALLLSPGRTFSSRRQLGLDDGIDDVLLSADLENAVVSGYIAETVYSDHPAYIIDCRLP